MKEGARQLLTNRLRHGKIKFTWDPFYIPAKKRLSDRVKSREKNAQPSYFHFHYNFYFHLPLQPKLDVRLGYKINYVNVLAENEASKLRSSTKPKTMTWSLSMDALVTVDGRSLLALLCSTIWKTSIAVMLVSDFDYFSCLVALILMMVFGFGVLVGR